MFYIFDNSGWFTGQSGSAAPRSTELDPVNYSTTTVDGAMRANWTGYSWVDREYKSPPADVAPTEPAKITRLAFRMRFTQSEKVMLEMASIDNPAAGVQARANAAGLRVALADQRDATFIDLNNTSTRTGVEQLETFGLLAAGRAAEILDAPVSESEAYSESVAP